MGIARALHFSLGSLQLFADVAKFNVIGIVGNAVLDICDAERDEAIRTALIILGREHEAQLRLLGKEHKRQLESLRDTAIRKIKEEQEKTQYVLEQYRKDVQMLAKRLKEQRQK